MFHVFCVSITFLCFTVQHLSIDTIVGTIVQHDSNILYNCHLFRVYITNETHMYCWVVVSKLKFTNFGQLCPDLGP